jgi:tetratricopeptide (TPR) repeat protein
MSDRFDRFSPVNAWRGWRLFAAAMAMLCAAPAGAGAAGEPADTHGGRIQFVRSLIEESSAAKRVMASQSAEAKARREQARTLHAEAVAADKAGDHAKAELLLGQAAKTMFEAVRLADHDGMGSGAAKMTKDYDNRLSSVDALLAAYDRICDEKKCDAKQRADTRRSVEAKLSEAHALRQRGDIPGARAALDHAYVALKVAIEHQRSGDTLVRKLEFKNKEEEYRYELDRNDTHRMLITVLLENREGSSGPASDTVRKFLDQASVLRAQAEKEAAAGRFESAIQQLENSTRELQRALRGAGIYIPG